MRGGFKVLINGRVERCNRFEVDFDEAKFVKNPDRTQGKTPAAEDFDRKTFAVMTVTKDDMEKD